MVSILADLELRGLSVVRHSKNYLLQKTMRSVPKPKTSIYKYAEGVLKSYPKELQHVIMSLNGQFAISDGEIFKSAGKRVLSNGDVYRFTRHVDQHGAECLTAQMLRNGEIISTKRKYFCDGLAKFQEKTDFTSADILDFNKRTFLNNLNSTSSCYRIIEKG